MICTFLFMYVCISSRHFYCVCWFTWPPLQPRQRTVPSQDPWYYLLQAHACVHACMHVWWVAQSCLTLCDSMDFSIPGSSVHGIFQERILECVAISYSRESSCKDQNCISCISCIVRHIIYQHLLFPPHLASDKH